MDWFHNFPWDPQKKTRRIQSGHGKKNMCSFKWQVSAMVFWGSNMIKWFQTNKNTCGVTVSLTGFPFDNEKKIWQTNPWLTKISEFFGLALAVSTMPRICTKEQLLSQNRGNETYLTSKNVVLEGSLSSWRTVVTRFCYLPTTNDSAKLEDDRTLNFNGHK